MERLKYNKDHWARLDDHRKALEQYLKSHFRPYNYTKFTLMMELLGPNLAGKKILDFGSGAGEMAIPCAKLGANVFLVDAEQAALDTARFFAKKESVLSRCEFFCSTWLPNSLVGIKYDIVILKDIIEHIKDDTKLLKDIFYYQKPGGLLLLSTQNAMSLNYLVEGLLYQKWKVGNINWCGWDPTHLRFYTPFSIKKKLTLAGYLPMKWRSVFIIPYNIFKWVPIIRKFVRSQLPILRYFDLSFGKIFPFNRLGWNFIVLAQRKKQI